MLSSAVVRQDLFWPTVFQKTPGTEWFWSKLWHCKNVAPAVFNAAYSWVELCDWVPAVLAGVTDPRQVKRGICAAGHKALYSREWGGLPDKEFLTLLDPALADLRDRLYDEAHDATQSAGNLTEAWAKKLGLPAGIPIAIGEFDVHYGAIGCGVSEGTLVKVIGTSTCDCGVVSAAKTVPDIPGICGIVKGAILPGFYGIEAGQSAVGDIFKWFVEGVLGDPSLHAKLTAGASATMTPAPGAFSALPRLLPPPPPFFAPFLASASAASRSARRSEARRVSYSSANCIASVSSFGTPEPSAERMRMRFSFCMIRAFSPGRSGSIGMQPG